MASETKTRPACPQQNIALINERKENERKENEIKANERKERGKIDGDTRRTTDWHIGRSASQRQVYMFENQLCTDVLFEVGPDGGETHQVGTHRYVLIWHSPVFEAMLCGKRMKEVVWPSEVNGAAKIRVTDVDVEVYREMLR